MIRGYEFGVLAAQIGVTDLDYYAFDDNAIRILDEVITSIDRKTFVEGFVSEKLNLGVGEDAIVVVFDDLVNYAEREGFTELATELKEIQENFDI